MMKTPKLPNSDTISYDSTKCTGCKVCELVCSFFHDNAFSTSFARIHIFNDLFSGKNSADICHHCVSPKCYFACPVNAIYIDENTGARILNREICVGCEECIKACPFNEKGHIIKYDLDKSALIKCDLCGGNPKCVEWCAPKALSYEKRGDR